MRKSFTFLAVLATLLFTFSCNQTKTAEQSIDIEAKAEQAIEEYVVQNCNFDEFEYEPINTALYSLYDYTPSEIGDCAEEIADIEWRLENPTVETNHYNLNTELQSNNAILYEMVDTLNNIDSLRTQSGWLIEHTYQITSMDKPRLPSATFTKTFKTDLDFNDVHEIFNPIKADMLKRRDIIIDNAIEQTQRKKR